ncbi:MAG: sugar transferase [Paraprevotella sp.]|nr:sugar transferase [Paraprevotella sp.]
MNQVAVGMEICDGMNGLERGIKRMFDLLCSMVGLVCLSPVFLYVYIKLRRQGDGPVIYRQERIGYKGKPFDILKFRTMKIDSEIEGVPQLAQKSDDRLTPVGCWLRAHHLDELPQLWNVFRGEMSFVGPRPERLFFIRQIMEQDPNYEYIYLMRPGLTSMATLYNGYTDTMEKMLIRLRMDLDYLQKRTLWEDLKIILVTVQFILKGKKF